MNINRDYLIINDVKKSNVKLDNGSIVFYITDKNTQNIFVNLVINISNNPLIQKYANIENAEDYTLTMNIVKPDNTHEIIQGKLHDKANAIFEFDLPDYCCDKVGSYKCELLTKCYINDREEITTSNRLAYKVKSSVLNDLDEMVEAPEYPLVIQLFDKLSDIEQYEEDRRTNELARQLAEEQRQTKHDELVANMTNSIQVMDNKVIDVENRIAAKEQAVNKLIVDTKADIDNYKVAKDQEIDEYKTAKDTEINNAIANQNTAINAQNDKILAVENNVVAQNDKLDTLETKATTHEARITATEAKNTEQDNRLDIAENRLANIGNDIANTMQPIIDDHASRLEAVETIDVSQNTRLDAIEAKNQQQDDRLLDIEKVNKRQDIDLKCLFTEAKNNMIDITEEGNSVYLQNSIEGHVFIDEIKGNTLVNCNKEPDKELILNGNINTSADNNVTITEGVDGGLVDVALEGNTLVNVSKTKDSTAISMSYTVENSGNHIALQGDIDGSCRPVVAGKTLVNLCNDKLNFTTDSDKIGNIYHKGYFKINKSSKKSYHYIMMSKDDALSTFKSNSKYTIIVNIITNTIVEDGGSQDIFVMPTYNSNNFIIESSTQGNYSCRYRGNEVGQKMCVITTKDFNNPSYPINSGVQFYTTYYGVSGVLEGYITILEGDYTDKPIPDYFTGLQSTFEDNLVTQEMVDSGEEAADNLGKYKVEYKIIGKNKFNINNVIIPIGSNCISISNNIINYNSIGNVQIRFKTYIKSNTNYTGSFIKTDGIIATLRIRNTENKLIGEKNSGAVWNSGSYEGYGYFEIFINTNSTSIGTISNIQVEEGDTATSYEPYKESTKTLYLNSPLLEGDTIEEKDGGIYHVHRSNKVVVNGTETNWVKNGEDNLANTYRFYLGNVKDLMKNQVVFSDKFKCTSYYGSNDYECIMVGGSTDIHFRIDKNKLSEYSIDSVKQYFSQNPITLVYKLKTPTYELIEQSSLTIPSYANGHLDFNTAVPVKKVEFKSFSEELTYLYANTQYTVQFVSDKAATADITLGGTQLLAQSIVAGLNRITITTPSELLNNKLAIDGVGANISEVVVTATDRIFRYFEGMKSVGECEGNEIEVLSHSKNYFSSEYNVIGENSFYGTVTESNGVYHYIGNSERSDGNFGIKFKNINLDKNTKYTFSYNFNAVNNVGFEKGFIKVYTDNKMIAESMGSVTFTTNNSSTVTILVYGTVGDSKSCEFEVSNLQIEKGDSITNYNTVRENSQILTHKPLRAVGDVKDRYVLIDGKWYIERKCAKGIIDGTSQGRTEPRYLYGNYFIMFTKKETHPIKRSPNNCISKNYKTVSNFNALININEEVISSVDNSLGIGIKIANSKTGITSDDNNVQLIEKLLNYFQANPVEVIYELETPVYEEIDYNPLEVYADTTHITTNSLIPPNIIVKNHGFNCLLKPSTTYTISSNLGLNTVTTPSTLTEDCLRFMDTDTSDVTTMRDVLVLEGDWTTKADLIPANFSGIESAFEQELITDEADPNYGKYKVNVKVANEDKSKENNVTFYIDEPLRGIGDVKDRVYIKDDKVVIQVNCGIRPYEDGDFGTYITDKANTVYPLAEPIYEEIEYNDTKLFIESFKSSTLFYNSNVPVTSKLYYSYSVPLVDTVAQTADISDQQDSMIIDMATQVAVMEMMLM